ncbi:hypothetical protein QA596_10285 [Balneolales bacterium ANBcel1]|nr:hypothetical protein [Balneolales bacterium ANBcel1]
MLPEYEQQFLAFHRRFVRYARPFFLGILGLVVLLLTVTLLPFIFPVSHSVILFGVGGITVVMGVLIMRFPFATPETVDWLGLEMAQKMARWAGLATLATGIVICLLTYL